MAVALPAGHPGAANGRQRRVPFALQRSGSGSRPEITHQTDSIKIQISARSPLPIVRRAAATSHYGVAGSSRRVAAKRRHPTSLPYLSARAAYASHSAQLTLLFFNISLVHLANRGAIAGTVGILWWCGGGLFDCFLRKSSSFHHITDYKHLACE